MGEKAFIAFLATVFLKEFAWRSAHPLVRHPLVRCHSL
jgi:hypothetical protein